MQPQGKGTPIETQLPLLHPKLFINQLRRIMRGNPGLCPVLPIFLDSNMCDATQLYFLSAFLVAQCLLLQTQPQLCLHVLANIFASSTSNCRFFHTPPNNSTQTPPSVEKNNVTFSSTYFQVCLHLISILLSISGIFFFSSSYLLFTKTHCVLEKCVCVRKIKLSWNIIFPPMTQMFLPVLGWLHPICLYLWFSFSPAVIVMIPKSIVLSGYFWLFICWVLIFFGDVPLAIIKRSLEHIPCILQYSH